MAKEFLITRPNHELITSYLHDFSKDLIEIIKATPDIQAITLEGSEANRNDLEGRVARRNPKLLFLNGHGNRKEVAGYKDEIILDEKNIKIAKNKIVYALSCDSLAELGQIAIKNGALAYIGYSAKFMIIRDPSRACNPSKDKNALPFKEACVTLINKLVFGSTVEEAIKSTKQNYKHSIRSYGTSKDDYGDIPLIRFALAWDYTFLGMEGDPTCSF